MKKRLICILLALALVLLIAPAAAFAEETQVNAHIPPGYVIFIPSEINFIDIGRNSGLHVEEFHVQTADLFLEDGAWVEVQLVDNGPLQLTHDIEPATLDYVLRNQSSTSILPGNVFTTFTASRTEEGTIELDANQPIEFPGGYHDFMTFEITYYNE